MLGLINANPQPRLSIRRVGTDCLPAHSNAGDKQMKIISKGKPASQIKSVRADTKKALILKAALKGASVDDIMKLTG